MKTSLDIARIRRPSRIVEMVLREVGRIIRPGITTDEIDTFCERLIFESRGVPALKGFNGFPSSVCTSINAVAAHGVPDGTVLRDGDILTVDLIVECDGWYSDAAWTYTVGTATPKARHLVATAWKALVAGILSVRAGGTIGDIGAAVHAVADRAGCSVLEDFAGHGIGRAIHEEPVVLHTGTAGTGLKLAPGMVFTIEPVICLGRPSFHILDDHWSCMIDDGSLSAQFEQTVAVNRDTTEILTLSGTRLKTCLDFPPDFE